MLETNLSLTSTRKIKERSAVHPSQKKLTSLSSWSSPTILRNIYFFKYLYLSSMQCGKFLEGRDALNSSSPNKPNAPLTSTPIAIVP